MLRAILIDNEEPAINVLNILLEKTGHVHVIETFFSATDALAAFQSIKPDVAFIDIEMPEINGLELAERISEINSDVEIIFVTAYDQYALEAFRVKALDYLLKPIMYNDVEQTVTRLIKRKSCSLVAQNTPSNCRVYCFGKIIVYGSASEEPVKWRTSKSEELFAYMLQNKEELVPKWKLYEALWPDCSPEKTNINLHTTIYKIKKVLTLANIKIDFKYINGCYILSLPGVYIDIDEFNSIVDSPNLITETTIAKYEKAFSLYKNNYLEGNDYIWSLPKKEIYSKKAYNLAISLVKYYMLRNEYDAIERILSELIEKFPFNETVHEMLLKTYFTKNNKTAFINHYNTMKESFRTELGIEPCRSIKSLYNSMVKG